jgi:hypothetical protein
MRFSETGIQKSVLVKFNKQQMVDVARANQISPSTFIKNYVIVKNKNERICLFEVNYDYTIHAQRPLDGKLRELNPDNYWLTVYSQFIVPKPGVWKYPPLPVNLIYA